MVIGCFVGCVDGLNLGCLEGCLDGSEVGCNLAGFYVVMWVDETE